jgi:hypothetical protein
VVHDLRSAILRKQYATILIVNVDIKHSKHHQLQPETQQRFFPAAFAPIMASPVLCRLHLDRGCLPSSPPAFPITPILFNNIVEGLKADFSSACVFNNSVEHTSISPRLVSTPSPAESINSSGFNEIDFCKVLPPYR